MFGCACIASMGHSSAQVEYYHPQPRLSVLTLFCPGPNELSVVDAKAVAGVFGAGGIPKGECEYSSSPRRVAFMNYADRRLKFVII